MKIDGQLSETLALGCLCGSERARWVHDRWDRVRQLGHFRSSFSHRAPKAFKPLRNVVCNPTVAKKIIPRGGARHIVKEYSARINRTRTESGSCDSTSFRPLPLPVPSVFLRPKSGNLHFGEFLLYPPSAPPSSPTGSFQQREWRRILSLLACRTRVPLSYAQGKTFHSEA